MVVSSWDLWVAISVLEICRIVLYHSWLRTLHCIKRSIAQPKSAGSQCHEWLSCNIFLPSDSEPNWYCCGSGLIFAYTQRHINCIYACKLMLHAGIWTTIGLMSFRLWVVWKAFLNTHFSRALISPHGRDCSGRRYVFYSILFCSLLFCLSMCFIHLFYPSISWI